MPTTESPDRTAAVGRNGRTHVSLPTCLSNRSKRSDGREATSARQQPTPGVGKYWERDKIAKGRERASKQTTVGALFAENLHEPLLGTVRDPLERGLLRFVPRQRAARVSARRAQLMQLAQLGHVACKHDNDTGLVGQTRLDLVQIASDLGSVGSTHARPCEMRREPCGQLMHNGLDDLVIGLTCNDTRYAR